MNQKKRVMALMVCAAICALMFSGCTNQEAAKEKQSAILEMIKTLRDTITALTELNNRLMDLLEQAAKPVEEPTADPTQPTDPVVDPAVDPAADPAVDPAIDPAADPAVEPAVDSAADPAADPAVDPAVDPAPIAPAPDGDTPTEPVLTPDDGTDDADDGAQPHNETPGATEQPGVDNPLPNDD